MRYHGARATGLLRRAVIDANIARMALSRIHKTLTRQTKRTRARMYTPRPPIGCLRRALSGRSNNNKKQNEIKKSLCRRSSRNHGLLWNIALRRSLQTRWACSEVANSVARGGPPATAERARTSTCGDKWGGGGSPSFSACAQARHAAPCASARAEEGARAAGRNGAPRQRARHLTHAPLLPCAACGRRAMTHARAARLRPSRPRRR